MAVTPPALAEPAVSRWQLLRAPVLTLAGLAAAAAALHARDPHVAGSWGFCPSRLLFGIDCPGCGGLRAVNDLTHLDLGAAASSNLLFVVSLPLIAWVFVRWLRSAWRGERYAPAALEGSRFYVGLVSLMVVFMVVRNLPFGAWLAS